MAGAVAAFTFDGQRIPLQPGDTIGSALHRAGVRVISRSLKYHRPRGLYCCTGSCASCLVDVDGVPNVTACMAPAKDGCKVLSQNRMGSAKHDLFGAVDKVYPRGFDPHNMFTRPRILNEFFLRIVRFMSGVGRAPKSAASLDGPRRYTLEVDELVIGAGAQGLARARQAALADTRSKILLIDELPFLGGGCWWDPLAIDTRRLTDEVTKVPNLTIWKEALCFGLYGSNTRTAPPLAAIARPGKSGRDLWEVRARRITVATGAHDAWPIFGNNDLPGVLSLRGALRLLGEHKVLPGRSIVVHGAKLPPAITAMLENAGATIVAQGEVKQAKGGTQVDAAFVNGEWVACDTVIANILATPRVELFQQAGCELGWARGVLEPKVDVEGRTTVPGIRALRAQLEVVA